MTPLPPAQYSNVVRSEPVQSAPHRLARQRVVRQLTTPGVRDVVTGQIVLAGPEVDEPRAWAAYSRDHPRRTYAVTKRQLSRAELRRFGLSNSPQ